MKMSVCQTDDQQTSQHLLQMEWYIIFLALEHDAGSYGIY